jgi:enoyl-CoA hydratase
MVGASAAGREAADIDKATQDGVKAATNDRDARFGDYSMASAERRPDPSHVIEPD